MKVDEKFGLFTDGIVIGANLSALLSGLLFSFPVMSLIAGFILVFYGAFCIKRWC